VALHGERIQDESPHDRGSRAVRGQVQSRRPGREEIGQLQQLAPLTCIDLESESRETLG
jgi:hypothetical protein